MRDWRRLTQARYCSVTCCSSAGSALSYYVSPAYQAIIISGTIYRPTRPTGPTRPTIKTTRSADHFNKTFTFNVSTTIEKIKYLTCEGGAGLKRCPLVSTLQRLDLNSRAICRAGLSAIITTFLRLIRLL